MAEANKNKQIDYRFRFLYAAGIVMMVAGHCANGGVSFFYEWFDPHTFILSLFLFCSGYFYKDRAEANIGKYILNKAKRLLIPLYGWNLFYGILVLLTSQVGFTIGTPVTIGSFIWSPLFDGFQFRYNCSCWFLAPLFLIEVINVLLRKILSFMKSNPLVKETVIFAFYLGVSFAGIFLAGKYLINSFFWWNLLMRVMFFISAYGLGTFYNRVLEKPLERISSWIYFPVVVGAEIIIITMQERVPVYDIAWGTDYNEGVIIPVLIGFLGVLFWMRIARIVEPVTRKIKAVDILAGSTIDIMMHHILGFMLIKGLIAVLAKITPFFPGFDFGAFKTEVFYYYLPHGMEQFRIIYLAAGVIIPVFIKILPDRIKKEAMKVGNK